MNSLTPENFKYIDTLKFFDRFEIRKRVVNQLKETWGFVSNNTYAYLSDCAVVFEMSEHNEKLSKAYSLIFPNSIYMLPQGEGIEIACPALFNQVIDDYRRVQEDIASSAE